MHGGDIYRNSVKFDFSVNINPLGIPSEVQWVLTEAALHADKYPDLIHEQLKNDTASHFEVPSDQIVYGNGASEIIMAACHAFAPKKALLVAPGFSGYSTCLKGAVPQCKIAYHYLKEENDFDYDETLIAAITNEEPDIVFITSPNNPNGKIIPKDLLNAAIIQCENIGAIIVVDECFLALTGYDRTDSLCYSIRNSRSLIVLRAMTKTYAIPGVRVGYAVCGKPSLAAALEAHLPEWNLSIFGQMAAVECLKHTDYVLDSIELIDKERDFLSDGLKKLGLKCYTTNANFILFKYDGDDLIQPLLEYGILIRDCSDYVGLDKGFYRLAIKQRNENEGLLSALEDIL
ncbi:MAG: aminotransferase class I/II-fold pyridoxal phosphate-dependent enzyme [Pseudobutyrivibrio sp.]|nr:aminotransferase class I/II-fold pyridoxal phosphate-dependent enzyme [Pseudobutyrivibrio sp.]